MKEKNYDITDIEMFKILDEFNIPYTTKCNNDDNYRRYSIFTRKESIKEKILKNSLRKLPGKYFYAILDWDLSKIII